MRILVRRAGSLGDVLFTTPIPRILRQRYADAEIDIETQWPVAYEGHAAVDSLAPYGDYDRVINLDMAHETRRSMHQLDAFLQAAELDGISEDDKAITLDHEQFGRIPGRVVMHANVTWPNRTHPKQMWQDTACGLVKLGYEVALTGTASDYGFEGRGITDMRSRLTLSQQASLIESADCLVSGSSMVGVLVGATETPCVALYTMTKAEHCMPYRHGELGWNYHGIGTPLPCYGCSERAGPVTYLDCERGDFACIGLIPAYRIVSEVKRAIEEDRRNDEATA